MNLPLTKKLKSLPQKPGVYIFKDAKGLVLYVGKTISLRNRVNSYFSKDPPRVDSSKASGTRVEAGGGDGRPNIIPMIPQIADVNVTVVTNELESLILEKNFISQLKPKYNIDLRDDKNYIFVKVNMHDEIPTIGFERRITDKKAQYYGPYTSYMAVKDTLRLVRKVFPYCASKKIGSKPCFYYHIGKCPGVCFGKITPEEYKEQYIKKIIQFLAGRRSEIISDLQSQMRNWAANKKFEKAAKVRDQIYALNRILERQKVIYPKKIDQDIFSLYPDTTTKFGVGVYQDGVSCINLFIVREGKLIRKENFILENTKRMSTSQIFEDFLPKYYLDASDKPKEILLPVHPGLDPGSYRVLSKIPAFAGMVRVPTRGQGFELIKLGAENAKQYLESTSDKHLLEEARLLSSLKELQRVLDLPELPGRIEAYDISNIQGTNPVGSMIVFDFGRPKKSDYRKFKINRKHTPDDFAMMKEMLERRFKNNWPLPNLILIDGGKGQLNAALGVLRKFQITNNKFQIPIIGLAKRLEEIFSPGRKNPIILPSNSIALFLLQRIRDEAHRFAVKYHRHLRSKGSLASILDEISGIGKARKKQLLQKFGSAAKVRQASITELAAIVGEKAAEKIKASL